MSIGGKGSVSFPKRLPHLRSRVAFPYLAALEERVLAPARAMRHTSQHEHTLSLALDALVTCGLTLFVTFVYTHTSQTVVASLVLTPPVFFPVHLSAALVGA